jgi:hypothetical protein
VKKAKVCRDKAKNMRKISSTNNVIKVIRNTEERGVRACVRHDNHLTCFWSWILACSHSARAHKDVDRPIHPCLFPPFFLFPLFLSPSNHPQTQARHLSYYSSSSSPASAALFHEPWLYRGEDREEGGGGNGGVFRCHRQL